MTSLVALGAAVSGLVASRNHALRTLHARQRRELRSRLIFTVTQDRIDIGFDKMLDLGDQFLDFGGEK